MSWNDFSDAEEQTGDVIPAKTLVKVRMKIRPGGYNDTAQGWTGGIATRGDAGAVYLDCEYTVIGGKYNKRKVWSLIGLYSPKGPKWGEMGRSFIRAALEAARGIKPDDKSPTAMAARRINGLADLDGLEFPVRIDVESDDQYGDKNKINNVIPASHKEYAALMAGTAPASASPTQTSAPAAAAPKTSLPAWAQ